MNTHKVKRHQNSDTKNKQQRTKTKLGEKELLEFEMDLGIEPAARLTVVYAAVLFIWSQTVQWDTGEMWIHNECSLITESEFDSVQGRHRFLKNGTAFERPRRSSRAEGPNGGWGGGEYERWDGPPPSRKGCLGDFP